MIFIENDTIEACHGIISQNSQGEVTGDQMRGDGVIARAAVAHGESRFDFTGDTHLLKSDNPALILAHTKEQNASGAIFGDRNLVGRNEGNSSPGDKRRTKEMDHHRRHPAAGGLATEGGNGLRMSQEEGRFFPNQGELPCGF